MSIEENLQSLENKTLSALRNIDPHTGNIHDYRNILAHVDRATRAVNNAHRAMYQAEEALYELTRKQ